MISNLENLFFNRLQQNIFTIVIPLDCGRFACKFVDDATDARYFGGDPVGDMTEERREFSGAGDHEVIGLTARSATVCRRYEPSLTPTVKTGHYGKCERRR